MEGGEKTNKESFLDTLILTARENPDTPTLDLHGETLNVAEDQLDKFLDLRYAAGDKVVRVVTGTGQGILARDVPRIVSSSPYVRRSKQFGPETIAVLDNF
ncbi:MAG: Smr/MutS family protein [bacterium]